MKDKIPLFDLVLTVMSNGINSSTYVKRAIILKDHYEIITKSKKLNLYVMNCGIIVSWLLGKLLKDCHSLMEESKCNKGCPKIVKSLACKEIDIDTVLSKDAPYLMARDCILGPQKCAKEDCEGQSTTTFVNTGGHSMLFDNF